MAVLLQGYQYEINYKPGKKNEVADALSRRPYPKTPDSLPEPEDVIPSANVSSFDSSIVYHETIFHYTNDTPTSIAATTSTLESICTIDTHPSISELQSTCPDFSPMYRYLKMDEAPEDRTQRDKLISESNFFVFSTITTSHGPREQDTQKTMSDNLLFLVAFEKMYCDHTMIA